MFLGTALLAGGAVGWSPSDAGSGNAVVATFATTTVVASLFFISWLLRVDYILQVPRC
jgi:hypothetical protein